MEERAESIAERSLSKGASDEDMFAIPTCFQLYGQISFGLSDLYLGGLFRFQTFILYLAWDSLSSLRTPSDAFDGSARLTSAGE